MTANTHQVGGTHYKTGTAEHWDWVCAHNIGYLEGCATKYVSRFRLKGGKQDLQKALHYMEKAQELLHTRGRQNSARALNRELTDAWLTPLAIPSRERDLILLMATWRTNIDLVVIQEAINKLIAQEYPT